MTSVCAHRSCGFPLWCVCVPLLPATTRDSRSLRCLEDSNAVERNSQPLNVFGIIRFHFIRCFAWKQDRIKRGTADCSAPKKYYAVRSPVWAPQSQMSVSETFVSKHNKEASARLKARQSLGGDGSTANEVVANALAASGLTTEEGTNAPEAQYSAAAVPGAAPALGAEGDLDDKSVHGAIGRSLLSAPPESQEAKIALEKEILKRRNRAALEVFLSMADTTLLKMRLFQQQRQNRKLCFKTMSPGKSADGSPRPSNPDASEAPKATTAKGILAAAAAGAKASLKASPAATAAAARRRGRTPSPGRNVQRRLASSVPRQRSASKKRSKSPLEPHGSSESGRSSERGTDTPPLGKVGVQIIASSSLSPRSDKAPVAGSTASASGDNVAEAAKSSSAGSGRKKSLTSAKKGKGTKLGVGSAQATSAAVAQSKQGAGGKKNPSGPGENASTSVLRERSLSRERKRAVDTANAAAAAAAALVVTGNAAAARAAATALAKKSFATANDSASPVAGSTKTQASTAEMEHNLRNILGVKGSASQTAAAIDMIGGGTNRAAGGPVVPPLIGEAVQHSQGRKKVALSPRVSEAASAAASAAAANSVPEFELSGGVHASDAQGGQSQQKVQVLSGNSYAHVAAIPKAAVAKAAAARRRSGSVSSAKSRQSEDEHGAEDQRESPPVQFSPIVNQSSSSSEPRRTKSRAARSLSPVAGGLDLPDDHSGDDSSASPATSLQSSLDAQQGPEATSTDGTARPKNARSTARAVVRQGYVCRLCGVPGHHIKDCSKFVARSNGRGRDKRSSRQSTPAKAATGGGGGGSGARSKSASNSATKRSSKGNNNKKTSISHGGRRNGTSSSGSTAKSAAAAAQQTPTPGTDDGWVPVKSARAARSKSANKKNTARKNRKGGQGKQLLSGGQ